MMKDKSREKVCDRQEFHFLLNEDELRVTVKYG